MMRRIIFALFVFVFLYPQSLYAVDVVASANRTAGVAPLSVHFSADLTNSSPTEWSFHDYEYSWDFDDSDCGNWGTTGAPKNTDKGAVASHVFESPGTYTVTLSVKDSADGSDIPALGETFVITVTDPDVIFSGTNTTCISDTTQNDFAGCPAGATHLATDTISAITTYLDAGERVLLHRGSSWAMTASFAYPSNAGPVTIGAYGTCANPSALGICENAPSIEVIAPAEQFIDIDQKQDWRIMDISFTAAKTGVYAAIVGNRDIQNLLVLRIESSGFETPITWYHYRVDDTEWVSETALVSSSFGDTWGMASLVGSERLAVMGNDIHNSDDTHILRVWQAYQGVISHNLLSGASLTSGTGRHALKLHGPEESRLGDFATRGSGGLLHRTKFVIVSDNVFGGSGPWPVSIGPDDDISEENLSDIIFERNRSIAQYGEQAQTVRRGVSMEARYATMRNNVIDGTGGYPEYTGITIYRRGIELTPLGNRAYNNTIYRSDNDTGTFIGILIGADADDTIVRNNYVSFPSETSEVLISDASPDLISSNNVLTDTPYFTDPDNVTPLSRDFSLTASSTAAIDLGYAVPLLDDFTGALRTGTFDIGAYEYRITNHPCGSMPPRH